MNKRRSDWCIVISIDCFFEMCHMRISSRPLVKWVQRIVLLKCRIRKCVEAYFHTSIRISDENLTVLSRVDPSEISFVFPSLSLYPQANTIHQDLSISKLWMSQVSPIQPMIIEIFSDFLWEKEAFSSLDRPLFRVEKRVLQLFRSEGKERRIFLSKQSIVRLRFSPLWTAGVESLRWVIVHSLSIRHSILMERSHKQVDEPSPSRTKRINICYQCPSVGLTHSFLSVERQISNWHTSSLPLWSFAKRQHVLLNVIRLLLQYSEIDKWENHHSKNDDRCVDLQWFLWFLSRLGFTRDNQNQGR